MPGQTPPQTPSRWRIAVHRRSPAWCVLVALALGACASLPPPQALEPSQLSGLAGPWQGWLTWPRAQRDNQWPVAMTVAEDGSLGAEMLELAPVTFPGTLAIRDGRVVLASTELTGVLRYHGGDGRRILEGEVRPRRAGAELAPPYTLMIEQVRPAVTAPGGRPAAPVNAVQLAATPVPDMAGAYVGSALVDRDGRLSTESLRLTLAASGIELSGAWLLGRDTGGVVTARRSDTSRFAATLSQAAPCAGTLRGELALSSSGTIEGQYAGADCGGPVTVRFTLTRE